MNDTTEAPFAFAAAHAKGGLDVQQDEKREGPAYSTPVQRRTRQAKQQAEPDAFDAFDRVMAILDPLPKAVRSRIVTTLERVYGR